jgi:hypothetical protein
LRERRVSEDDLRKIQERRMFPTRVTQAVQVFMQQRFLRPILGADRPVTTPWILRLFKRFPFLRRIPARLVGIGIRPEHVKTPDVFRST